MLVGTTAHGTDACESEWWLVQVFFDVSIGGEAKGRITMQLNADVCPKTAINFKVVHKSVEAAIIIDVMPYALADVAV